MQNFVGIRSAVLKNIGAAFRGMHVSPAKHSSASVTDGQTDRQTDRQTDGQTDRRRTKVIPMCRYASQATQKWCMKLLFLVIFQIFPNWNCHFRSGLWKAGCDVVSMYVLQSYRSCTFCKRKTRGETQFWIELAAPCTLANHNEINSDDTLPFIIFLTPVSCDGSNPLWRQHLLLSSCFLWRHKQTLFGVIRPLAGRKCWTFSLSHWTILF